MTTIPDGLPSLAKGAHAPEDGKACVMEYISVITGDHWTDQPACTNLLVAKAAQAVNDHLDDNDRQKVVPFIHRLAAAGGSNAAFEETMELRTFESTGMSFDFESLGSNVYEWIGWQMSYSHPLSRAELGLRLLNDILKDHERLVQHEVPTISDEALAKARALIESRALVVTT